MMTQESDSNPDPRVSLAEKRTGMARFPTQLALDRRPPFSRTFWCRCRLATSPRRGGWGIDLMKWPTYSKGRRNTVMKIPR